MIIRESLKNWRTTWFIGILLLLVSTITNKHLFFIYYYFFFAGIISLFNFLKSYLILNENQFIIKKIFQPDLKIELQNIKSVEKATIETNSIQSYGGRIRVSGSVSEEKQVLLINLFKPININTQLSYIISNNPHELYLDTKPEYGINYLTWILNKHINTDAEQQTFKTKILSISFLNLSIFITSFILILINLNKYL